MAENEQEKTEAPTQRRRDEARDEGRIPKSQELATALLLCTAALALTVAGPALGRAMLDVFGVGLSMGAAPNMDATSAVRHVQRLGWRTLAAMAGVLGAMTMAALVIGAAQARGTFTVKTLAPKFERLDPMQNAKRVFGLQGWVELLKALVKMLIVGWAVYRTLGAAWGDLTALPQQSPAALLEIIRRYSVGLLLNAGLAYLALAAADYAFQLWQHEKSLRMSKEELKQEMKNSDGDPMVKHRMRSLARQRLRQQMFRDVPKADVVLVNPTHIAIALKYDPAVAPAPYVIAMGSRKVAERIKKIAFESGVPVIENKPVARALIASAKVGMMIPTELYLAVAEVLAFVIRSRGAGARQRAAAGTPVPMPAGSAA